jgi:CheY-like chemotaxis protein
MRTRSATVQTLLLVDDDADFLELNATALDAAGFQTVCAYSQEEALRLIARTRIDAAILDVMMESHDAGFRLARSLRQNSRTKQIPIVLLTCINEHNRARKLYTFSDLDRDETWLPVDRILEKPCAPSKLVSVLKELLGAKCRAED